MYRSRIEERLAQETRAEVRFNRGERLLYATDASLYQIEPVGVVVPRTRDDVTRAVRIAAEEGVAVLPRGAATSLSGQTVGRAIVLDFSKYLNRIGVVDRNGRRVHVEPGVVLDHLNAHLRPLGLMFGPDVSTSDRATIGGMLGNNSAGARSLRYGKTVDHVRAVDVVLADGTEAHFGPVSADELQALRQRNDRVGHIYRTVIETVETHREAIAARFPRILRRVSGYNLDELVPGLAVRAPGWKDHEPWSINLAKLIVGSEGTLAVVTGADLRVEPVPAAQGLVVLSFATIPAALERLHEILETGPAAVEMVDRMILELATLNPEFAKSGTFAEGLPAAVLAAQYFADSQVELEAKAMDLARRFEGRAGVLGARMSLTESARDDFWKIRKAGVSLLMGMVGDAKPVAFVEDTAVSPEKLPEFFHRFNRIIELHGTVGACYGHADVGCLHIRPVIDVKRVEGVEKLRAIAQEVSDLVLEFGGAMSGEHGDGLARSKWNRKLFGDEVYGAFEAIKRAFDPEGLLNPGKVVADPDPGSDLRIGPSYHVREPVTAFDFSSQGGFSRAVEMCSGVGACRKTTGGTMCPSYMVTLDETHTTRARGNALRLLISGQLKADGPDDPTVASAMDLCLQCKACKTECPSNVDMAKLKAEWLHQTYRSKAVPPGALLMGHVHVLNRFGSAAAPLANWTLRQPFFQVLLEKVAGIDRRRTLPTFQRDHLRKWFCRHEVDSRAGTLGEVILLDDCFTTYNQPQVGRSAVKLLEAAGYRVRLAGLPCCGRPAISKGLLPLGKELARGNVARLVAEAARGTPILGCEPSCLLTLADDYRDFRLGLDADRVAASCHLVDEFLADPGRVPELPLKASARRVLVHGHCHQKALVGTSGTMAALRRVPGLDVRELDSGCCGMAGSFGYELGHFDVSSALAERVLLPALRGEPGAVLAAPGFSCRSQVHGLAGVEALHPVEVLAACLE
jgi:FAD/FMN-containing dehydrogenase/Fe-S oxidoreductase